MYTNGSLIHTIERHPVNLSDMIYLTMSVLKFSYLLPGSLALMWAMRIAPAFLVLLEHTVELKATALHVQQVLFNIYHLH